MVVNMKQRESYLDQELLKLSKDGAVHVVHSADHNMTVSYIIIMHPIIMHPRGGLVAIAHVAKRNPKDNFCRRIGRLISKGRLLQSRGRRHVDIDSIPTTADEWRALDRRVLELFA